MSITKQVKQLRKWTIIGFTITLFLIVMESHKTIGFYDKFAQEVNKNKKEYESMYKSVNIFMADMTQYVKKNELRPSSFKGSK